MAIFHRQLYFLLPDTSAGCPGNESSVHNPGEITNGSKPGLGATKKLPGEGFKRAWSPLVKMDKATWEESDVLLKLQRAMFSK